MNISSIKGNHYEKDKIFLIETEGAEAFTLYKYLLLTNQLAFNEANKYNGIIKRGYPLFFEEATKKVINLGKQGYNLLDDDCEEELKKLCNNYNLKFEKFKQTKLNEFEK